MTVFKRLIALIGVASLTLASVAAEAAMLDLIQGEVLVNRGGGYEDVNGPTELKPGDLVIANPGGSAQVVYADGSIVPVQPGTVVTVGESAAAAAAEATAAAGSLSTSTLVVGGLVVAGGVGLAVALSNKGSDSKDDKPASP